MANPINVGVKFSLDSASLKSGVQEASREFQAMGKSASGAAATSDQATKSLINDIQRTVAALEAGERGSVKFYQALAQQRGASSEALQPFLQQLEAARKGMDNVGVSAAQTAAAMRQVPAQVTDMVVGLQSGQAPMTVLLQQGGQLKDMFGGTGAAVKALGTYALGLVTPVTATVAALALVGGAGYLAWKQNREEVQAFDLALSRTNNVIGMTTGELSDMATVLAGAGFSRTPAAEAIAALARSGDVARQDLSAFTQTALDMSKYVDQSVGDTVKVFSKLADEPAKASAALTKETHYLTAAQMEQIKSLEEMGQKTDAARLAQQAYADSVAPVVAAYKANLGPLDTALEFWTKKARTMWDALRGGGSDTTSARIAALKQQLAELSGPTPLKNANLGDAILGSIDEQGTVARLKAAAEAKLAYLQQVDAQVKKNAETEGAYRRAQDDANAVMDAVTKTQDKGLSKQAQMNKALDLYREQIEKIKAANPDSALVSADAISRGEAAIREQYKSTAKANTELEKQARLINELGGLKGDFTEQWNRLSAIYKSGGMNLEQLQAAQAKLLADQPAVKEQQKIYDDQAKALAKSVAAYDQIVDATRKSADQIGTQADELEARNSMWHQGRVAVEEYRQAVIEAKLAEIDQNPDSYRADYIAEKERELEEQRRKVAATREAEYKTLSEKQQEYTRQVAEEAQLYQDEVGILGLTGREREKVVAIRKVELDLAKRLAEIERSGATDQRKQELIDAANASAEVAKTTAAAKADMNATTDIINSVDRTAASVWSNVTQGGVGAFKKVGQTIQSAVLDLIYQLTIKKWVVNITAQITSLFSGGGNILSNLLGGGDSSLGSFASTLGSAATALTTATNSALATAQSWIGMTGTAAQASTAAANGVAYAATGSGSMAATIGAYAPYVAAALLAYQVLSSLDGGETRTGGQYSVAYGGEVKNNRRGESYQYVGQQYNRDNSLNADGTRTAVTNGQAYLIEADGMGKQEKAVKDAVTATATSINDTLKALGSKATTSGYWAGLETSGNGRGGVFAGGALSNGKTFGETGKGDNYSGTLYEKWSTTSPDSATAMANFTLDLKQSYLQALQADMDELPKVVGKLLKDQNVEEMSSTEVDTLIAAIGSQITAVKQFNQVVDSMPFESLKGLSFDAAAGLVELSGGIDKLSSNLSSYLQNYYSETERQDQVRKNISASLADVGLSLPATREAFKALVDAQDKETESGRKAWAALMAVQDAFASVTPSAEAAAKATADQAAAEKAAAEEKAKAAADAAAALKAANKSATDAAYQALQNSVSAQKTALQATEQTVQATISKLKSLFDTLGSAVSELYAENASTAAQSAAQGKQFIADAVAAAQNGGALPDQEALTAAIAAVRASITRGNYATPEDMERDRMVLAAQLNALKGVTGTQLTTAEEQLQATQTEIARLDTLLDTQKAALDALRGNVTATLSVSEAVAKLAAAVLKESADATAVATKPATTSESTSGASSQFVVGGGGSGSGSSGSSSSGTSGSSGSTGASSLFVVGGSPVKSFAVGTDYVSNDMLAQIHQGERIVPAAYNRSDATNAELLGVLQIIAALLERSSGSVSKVADILSSVQRGPFIMTKNVA